MKRLLPVIALLPLIVMLSFRNKENIRGVQYIFSWESKTEAVSDIKRLYNMDTSATKLSFFQSKSLQLINLEFRCSIRKTIVEVNNSGQLVCFELMNPVVNLRQNGQTINSQLLRKELSRPLFAEISTGGIIKWVTIDTTISQVSGGLIKEMISHLQFALPSGKVSTWHAEEENTAGRYLAKYQVVDSNNAGFTYLKVNDGYIRLRSAVPNQEIKENGRTAITVDSLGGVTGIDMLEAKTVMVRNDTISLSRGKAQARLISVGAATDTEMAGMVQLAGTSNYQEKTQLSARLSDDKINRLTYARTLADDNFKTLDSALRQVTRDDAEAIDRLTAKFRSLAYLAPVHCNDMTRLLQSAEFDSPAFQILSQALNNAQTPAAVDALADVVRARRHEEDVLNELVPMLTTAPTPTTKAETAVRQLLQSPPTPGIRTTAELALGGIAFNFRKLDPSRSADITKFLLEKMRTETDTIQKILVLANTGGKEVLPVIKEYFQHRLASAEVIQTSIFALRLIDDDEVDVLLENMLNDTEGIVVELAKEVIAFRKERFQDR